MVAAIGRARIAMRTLPLVALLIACDDEPDPLREHQADASGASDAHVAPDAAVDAPGSSTDTAGPDTRPAADVCPPDRPFALREECLPCQDPRASCTDWDRYRQLYCSGGGCLHDVEPEARRVRGAIRAGALGIDPQAFLQVVSGARSTCPLDDWPLVQPELALACFGSFWVGRTPLGAPCDTAVECANGVCQRSDTSRSRPHYVAGGCGVCAAWAEKGAPCGPASTCRPGLRCTDGRCQEPPAPPPPVPGGEPCGDALGPCDSEHYCDDVCRPYGDVGAGCAFPYQCKRTLTCKEGRCAPSAAGDACFEACSAGLVCDPGALTCRPRVGLGEECVSAAQCPGTRCVLGRCTADIPIGQACVAGPSGESACVARSECRGGVCQPWSSLGGPCARNCLHGRCENGVCRTPAVGTTCQYSGVLFDCGALTCAAFMDGPSQCVEPSANGASCTRGAARDACREGSYCNARHACAPICILDR